MTVSTTGEDDLGINQYLIYSLNDCLAAGVRAEWWRDDGTDYFEVTGGLNYRPHANVVIRPEVRFDRSDDDTFEQTSCGVDTILTF